MYKYDDPTVVAQLPAPAAAGTPGYFTDGNPAQGLPATILRADYMNMIMMELINVVQAGGIPLSKTTYNQVLSALNAMYYQKGGAIDNSPIGQTTPAVGAFTTLTNTGLAALSSGFFTGTQAPTSGAGVRLIFAAGAGSVFAYDYTAGQPKILQLNAPGGNVQVGSGADTGDKAQFFGTTWLGGAVKFGGGAWAAPAVGNGIAYGNSAGGLQLAGNGSTNDITVLNKNNAIVFAIPTGTQRAVFNGAADTGDSGIFGGAVAIGSATAAQHAVRYDQTLGLGQTWQSLAASRAFGTTYTNTNNKPIQVVVSGYSSTTNAVITANVGGVTINGAAQNAAGNNASISFIVPPGATYSVSMSGTTTLSGWYELR